MKDAFGNDLELGDMILYSTGGSAGTKYMVGTIQKMHPCQPSNKSYYPPDRVSIDVQHHTCHVGFSKNPIIYASNVVRIESLPYG